ncbi:MAG TPA: metallophosphoesterase [Oscillospiraceae bacterium]|nr:metallophosphoesterase [Oscillospiraceae bacterium]
MKRRLGLKALAVLLAVMMLSTLLPITASADSVTACIGITSDVHGSYTNISAWLDSNDDGSLKYMVFGGDMGSVYWKTSATDLGTISTNTSYSSDGDQTVGKINDLIDAQYPDTTPIYTMGNHDWYIGSAGTYTNADTLSFEPITGFPRTGIQNDPDEDGFTIYTLGAVNGNTGDGTAYLFSESDIADLETALAAAEEGEPFFIVSHFPLHYGSSRKGQNSSELIDLLNNYPNVFFFWGHNHHSVESLLNTIKVAGDTIVPSDATSTTKTLNFTYANSGHMGSGDSSNGVGVFIEITDNGDASSVTLTYMDMDGSTVGSSVTVDLGAVSNEIAAVSVTGITSPAADAEPDTDAAVSTGGVSVSAVSWLVGGVPFTGTAFSEGVAYTAQVTLTATGSKVFTASTSATVNGKEATSVTLNLDGTLDVTYEFPQASESSLTYTKVSSVSSGHQYAIVTDGIAMNNTVQTGSTSYYSYVGLGYTTPSISSDGNTLTFDSADDAEAATWTFESTGNADEWIVSNEGSYLYAPQSRSLELDSENNTSWIFGTLESDSQLYTTLYDSANDEDITCKLFYGGTSTVDFFYPSVNNDNDLTLYEKDSSVSTPTVDSIAITNPPTKTAYTAGETFDTAGMQVTAYYSDASSAVVTGYSVSPSGALSVSDTEIVVTYHGKSASQTISVDPAVLFIYKKTTEITDGHEYAVVLDDVAMGNTVTTGTYSSRTYTGLSYVTPTIVGDYLIFASAADASSATWTFSEDDSGWDIQSGTLYVNATAARTMSLGDAQAWTYGTVSDKGTQLSVVLSSSTYNLFYGGTTTVDFVYPSTNNSNTLVLYEKQSAALSGIEITTPPTKTTYSAGESFDATDMVVTALFDDDSSEIITDYAVSPSDALAVTDSLVTVSFLGKTATQAIDVFPAGSTTYTLADTIEAGGKYVIVSNLDEENKALQNAVTSTSYLASPAVTVSGDEVTSSVSSDMIWTAETGSTGMLFQNDGDYLARGSSISSGRYGLTAGSKPSSTLGDWFYSSHTLYVTSGSTSYYLYISSQDYFRMNTSAQSGESIYLYKQNATSVTLENITVAGAQTSYTEGQTFDPTGMVVTAHFSDGSSNPIVNYIYTPSGVLSTENTRVTIVYHGKTAVIDITVAAVPVNYTVTWMNGTAQLEQDVDVPSGTAPSYDDIEPTKPATAQYTYSFAGWSTDPDAVTGTLEADLPAVSDSVIYYAVFTETLNQYTVTYAPGTHGAFTAQVTNDLTYGDTTPAAPIVIGSSGWTFAGWDPEPAATVTGTVTYTATWTQDTYTVTYAPGTHGAFTAQVTNDLTYGDTTPAAPTVIGSSGWTFAGWDPEPAATVTGTVTYTATWTQDTYTVTYAPGTHGAFTAQVTNDLTYGDTTPAAPTVIGSSGWAFAGWDPEPTATVTGTVTYTATWTQDDSELEVHTGYFGAASVEGAESGKRISITLTNGQFLSWISSRQFTLTGLPSGVRKGIVTRVSDNVVTITLWGNSNVDYDEDITVQIGIDRSQIQPTPENDITASVTLTATVEPSPDAPISATFSYSGRYANRLRGVTTAMEYSLNGGVSYSACRSTSVTLSSAQLNSLDADKDILVRYEATLRVPAGIPQVIDLLAGADVPDSVAFNDEANTLTGMSTDMEFSTNGGTDWTDYTGSNLPDLTGNITVMVRYTAFDTTAAGAPATFIFTSANPLLSIAAVNNGIIEGSESGKTITVTLTNGTFASSLSTRKITLDGLPAGVRLRSTTRDSDTVATLTLSGNSTVDYDSDLEVTVSFDKSLFVPTQETNLTAAFTIAAVVEISPSAPTTAAFTFSGSYANRLTGVTTEMEYSLDGGVSYSACRSTSVTLSSSQLSSLDAGKDILVRYEATLRTDASDNQLIDLLEGKPLPDTVTGDDTNNKMSGMVQNTMEYSTNGRTWITYTGTLPSLTGNVTLYVRMCAYDNTLPGEAESFVFTGKFYTIFWFWYR